MDSHAERDSTRDRDDSRPAARRTTLILGIGLYLLTLGALVGTIVERIRFDYRRDSVLERYDALLHARQAAVMGIQREVAQVPLPTSGERPLVRTEMRAEADD